MKTSVIVGATLISLQALAHVGKAGASFQRVNTTDAVMELVVAATLGSLGAWMICGC